MGYIKDSVIEEAWEKDNFLGGIVSTLDKLGVIGTDVKRKADQLCDFLTRKKIPHDNNGDRLVWVESLESSELKKLFKRKSKTVEL